MEIWPRVNTFMERRPLDLHTNSSKHTRTSPLCDAHLPGLRNPKQLAIHLGLISCPGEQKQAPQWQTGHPFCIITTADDPSPCFSIAAMLAPSVPRLQSQSHSKEACYAPSFKRMNVTILI